MTRIKIKKNMENKCIETISEAFGKLQNKARKNSKGEKKPTSLPASPKSLGKDHPDLTSITKVYH